METVEVFSGNIVNNTSGTSILKDKEALKMILYNEIGLLKGELDLDPDYGIDVEEITKYGNSKSLFDIINQTEGVDGISDTEIYEDKQLNTYKFIFTINTIYGEDTLEVDR